MYKKKILGERSKAIYNKLILNAYRKSYINKII